ncbi:hypothetical protein NXY31_18955 [Bacteroides salyersiae]|nr:hypothetical protein [Bacteroides salyersiae]
MKLLDYIRGTRKGKEAHRLQKEAMRDPFLADAMDGYDSVGGEPGVSDRDFTSPDQGKSKGKTESCCCVECSGELIDRCLFE